VAADLVAQILLSQGQVVWRDQLARKESGAFRKPSPSS